MLLNDVAFVRVEIVTQIIQVKYHFVEEADTMGCS
jgi:hypothetical protein